MFVLMGDVVTLWKNKEDVFYLNDIIYDYFNSDLPKRLQKHIKYSILLKIKEGKLIDVVVTNEQIKFKTKWLKRDFLFDKITV